ncbi:hypothetical protein NUU61_003587 [Penicillium alfredii]|uniref:Uncharacterized protein n=1 Tax=Penicillium alfredii TaxID=1506179 RepID=A0A9W9FJL7_9EURO|nr:uncharacterized protein NUU61_003587 [Penicillium alfredii]KAJ5101365.1 hypothetical protein NUU61_003587 [Penicillium alfredii]
MSNFLELLDIVLGLIQHGACPHAGFNFHFMKLRNFLSGFRKLIGRGFDAILKIFHGHKPTQHPSVALPLNSHRAPRVRRFDRAHRFSEAHSPQKREAIRQDLDINAIANICLHLNMISMRKFDQFAQVNGSAKTTTAGVASASYRPT